MFRISSGVRLALCAACLSAVTALAQRPIPLSGPVPPAIHAAKKIFLSNAVDISGNYSGGPTRAYDMFYAALKANSQFEMVSDPSDADLVLELHIVHANSLSAIFKLVIYDCKSHYVLWTLSESVDLAQLQSNRDSNFDKALSALIGDFQTLTGKSPTPATH
jgi:hypothetical protein